MRRGGQESNSAESKNIQFQYCGLIGWTCRRTPRKFIVDDDGYIELRFWVSPGAAPEHVTTILTRAIAALTASG